MDHPPAPALRVRAFNYIPARRQAVVFDTETTGVTGADRVVCWRQSRWTPGCARPAPPCT